MQIPTQTGSTIRAVAAMALLAGSLLLAPLPASAESAHSSGNSSDELVPNTFVNLAERTLPSVVAVYVKMDMRDQVKELRDKMEPFKEFFDDPQFKRFFDKQQQEEKDNKDDPHGDPRENRTSGSGVVISHDGYIVTNNHIVEQAKPGTISVVLNDDTEIHADKVKLIAKDELLDLAILKVDPAGLDLKPIAWGNSDKMRIGDWVVAIGNPLDLRGSVSKGIISAKTRKIGKAPIEHLLQTDAMINPGNSGGALINLQGELIGINMAIATNSGFFQGIGFAIPSNDARFIADQVIKDGRIRRGYIGIIMKPLEEESLRKALGIAEGTTGIIVQEVVADAPAAKAGVQPYDVISKVDGANVKDTSDLLGIIASKRVGDSAELAILRRVESKTKEVSLRMQVTERPTDPTQVRSEARWKPKEETPKLSGMTLSPIRQESKGALQVTAVEPRSPAARAGIAPGDVILEVNRKPVGSLKDFTDSLSDAGEGTPFLVRYERDGRSEIVAVNRPEAK